MWQVLLGTLVVIAAFMATFYLLGRRRRPRCGSACECHGDVERCPKNDARERAKAERPARAPDDTPR